MCSLCMWASIHSQSEACVIVWAKHCDGAGAIPVWSNVSMKANWPLPPKRTSQLISPHEVRFIFQLSGWALVEPSCFALQVSNIVHLEASVSSSQSLGIKYYSACELLTWVKCPWLSCLTMEMSVVKGALNKLLTWSSWASLAEKVPHYWGK